MSRKSTGLVTAFALTLASGLVASAASAAAPGQLELVIDSATGATSIVGNDSVAFQLSGYEIISPGGSLVPAPTGWVSLASRSIGGFAVLSNAATDLAEGNFDGTNFATIDGTGFSIGNAFNTSGAQDLTFLYADTSGNPSSTGNVVYSAVPEPATAGLLALGGGLLLARRRRAL